MNLQILKSSCKVLKHGRIRSTLVRSLCSSTELENNDKFVAFKVDRTGLLGHADISGSDDSRPICEKEEPSPLTKDLTSLIKMRGPITLHNFMAQALNHSVHGYYQHKLEKIGTGGDFITAPEISQLFGEMVGVWIFSVWDALGKPKKLRLVEMGPGKGTLMRDILKVSKQFPEFQSALSVHMVELSQSMRRLQHDKLVGEGTASTPSPTSPDKVLFDDEQHITRGGTPVTWHSFLRQVPDEEQTPLVAVGERLHTVCAPFTPL